MHRFQAALVFCVLALKIEFFRNAFLPMPLHTLLLAEIEIPVATFVKCMFQAWPIDMTHPAVP